MMLLLKLCSLPGDLLEDEVLIGTLKDATHTASEVKERLQKAFETRESISNSRLKYERVSFMKLFTRGIFAPGRQKVQTKLYRLLYV